MAEKLRVNYGNTYIGRKLWEKHQSNEYKRVSNYKEALCFNCFKTGAATATIVDICHDCIVKKGHKEAMLAKIKENYYGYCFFCDTYKFTVYQINARFCKTCNDRIIRRLRDFNKKGGYLGVDPFWLHMKRKHGKDWKIIMSDPTKTNK